MTTMREPLRAVRLTDGTYVVRSCCTPSACAPAVGSRCCRSARCDCPIPAAWLRRPTGPPIPAEPAPRNLRPLVVAGALLPVGVGAAWGVAEAVAWIVSHALLIAGGTVGLGVLLLAGLRAGGGRSCATTVTFRHRH